jgi:uncharacterized membrane protein
MYSVAHKARSMSKGRLEAFSDGVLAIIITIMVLELHAPHDKEHTFASLQPLWPTFLAYLLSFGYLAIYWNNHHHMLQASRQVSGAVLWANMHLLFWLSLIPFATSWMGGSEFAAIPVATYGGVLFLAGIAYRILLLMLIRCNGKDSPLAVAVGRDRKGKLSVVLYAAAIALALVQPWIACAIYALVAVMWFVPDRRIARVIDRKALSTD